MCRIPGKRPGLRPEWPWPPGRAAPPGPQTGPCAPGGSLPRRPAPSRKASGQRGPTHHVLNRARVSSELELLAQGLFPPLSRNCPGARGEGDLTEAAGSGGAPAPEAMTVVGTAGRVSGRPHSAWSGARAAAQDQLLRGRGSLPPAAAVQKERPSASGPGELRSLLSPLPSAWLAGPGVHGEGLGLSVLRGNVAREAQGPAAASAPLLPTAGKAAEISSRDAQAPYSAESLCDPSSLS